MFVCVCVVCVLCAVCVRVCVCVWRGEVVLLSPPPSTPGRLNHPEHVVVHAPEHLLDVSVSGRKQVRLPVGAADGEKAGGRRRVGEYGQGEEEGEDDVRGEGGRRRGRGGRARAAVGRGGGGGEGGWWYQVRVRDVVHKLRADAVEELMGRAGGRGGEGGGLTRCYQGREGVGGG